MHARWRASEWVGRAGMYRGDATGLEGALESRVDLVVVDVPGYHDGSNR